MTLLAACFMSNAYFRGLLWAIGANASCLAQKRLFCNCELLLLKVRARRLKALAGRFFRTILLGYSESSSH